MSPVHRDLSLELAQSCQAQLGHGLSATLPRGLNSELKTAARRARVRMAGDGPPALGAVSPALML